MDSPRVYEPYRQPAPNVEFEDPGAGEPVSSSKKEGPFIGQAEVYSPPYSNVDRKPLGRQYKPLAHRSISFIALGILLLAAIGIIEYGQRVLPHTSFRVPTNVKIDIDFKHKRQVESVTPTPVQGELPVDDTNTSPVPGTSARPPEDFADPNVETTPPPPPPPSSYADPNVVVESPPTVELTRTSSDYANGIVVTTPITFGAPPSADYASTTVASNYAPTAVVTGPVGVGTNTADWSGGDITASANPELYTSDVQTFTSEFLVASTIVSTDGTSLITRVSTFTSTAVATHTPAATPLFTEVPLQFINRPYVYFSGVYLPVLLAVIIRMLLGYLYSSTKMMEPFYELSQGTTAANFLWTNYLDSNDLLAPFHALVSGQWLVLAISIAYLLSQLLAPFSSELVGVIWSRNRVENVYLTGNALWISTPVARIMQGLLAVVFLILILVWSLTFRQRSGIYDDPSSIATVASLLEHPRMISSFKHLDANCEKSDISRYLGDSLMFKLDVFSSPQGLRYGIIPFGHQAPIMVDTQYNPQMLPSNQYYEANHDGLLPQPSPERKGPRAISTLLNILLTLSILGTLGVIVAYYKNSDLESAFEKFMDSESFGPGFLFTCVGIIIKSQWSRLERLAVTNEPFWSLYKKPCTAETLLATRALDPFSSFFNSMFRGSFYVALLSFNTILSEFLIVLLPGVPYARGQLFHAAKATWLSSMALLAFMAITMIVVWLQKSTPWPRAPNSVGALILYLADTGLASELSAFADTTGSARNKEMVSWGKQYRFTKVHNGEFGTRWIVEFVNSPEAEMLLNGGR